MNKAYAVFLLLVTLCMSYKVFAAPIAWQIVPDKSEITFTGTQNGSPVLGKFKKFGGEIKFDPADLKSSSVTIIVDMNSVSTSYSDIANTLRTPDWFDTISFPQAQYKADNFTHIGNNNYLANGTLTIRDKSSPIVLKFTIDQYTKTSAHAKGSTTLKRTALGVGKGEWANTDNVKDEVQINFVVTAIAK